MQIFAMYIEVSIRFMNKREQIEQFKLKGLTHMNERLFSRMVLPMF